MRLLALLAFAQLAPVPPTARLPLVLARLELDLRVDYGRGALDGTATLTVRNQGGSPVGVIPLLLNRLMRVAAVTDRAGSRIPFAQRVALFVDDSSRQVNAITVSPRRALRSGDSLRFQVRYGGILVGYTETGSLYIQDRVAREFTILREDAYAFPVLGVLSRQANRLAPREPFGFAARISVPAGLVVAMGGSPRERSTHDSLATWSYQSDNPVPFLNITIAPYQVLEGPSTRIFSFPADSAGARQLQASAAAALDAYARWYGPLPGAPHLVVMEIPEGFGSQASLSAGIIQTADAFRNRSELRQVYHELSHLWNVPDLDGPSPRWNEGLATFLQWRMAALLDGWNGWEAQAERTAKSLLQRCAEPAPCHSIPLNGYGAAGQTDRAYGVGMLLFYALYQALGAEHFDSAYRGFVARYHTKGATTADLAAAFRDASTRAGPILEDWLTTTRWYSRLASGESIAQILASYARP